jgi:hypothetical protein
MSNRITIVKGKRTGLLTVVTAALLLALIMAGSAWGQMQWDIKSNDPPAWTNYITADEVDLSAYLNNDKDPLAQSTNGVMVVGAGTITSGGADLQTDPVQVQITGSIVGYSIVGGLGLDPDL